MVSWLNNSLSQKPNGNTIVRLISRNTITSALYASQINTSVQYECLSSTQCLHKRYFAFGCCLSIAIHSSDTILPRIYTNINIFLYAMNGKKWIIQFIVIDYKESHKFLFFFFPTIEFLLQHKICVYCPVDIIISIWYVAYAGNWFSIETITMGYSHLQYQQINFKILSVFLSYS